ncbi:hypothetical protein E0K83_03205 [Gramella sp. BOM4]|nr:hypothetical protein [Christiangramia bathymodioli]
MKKLLLIFCSIFLISTMQSCGVYSFTGADTGNAETFQVNFFQNNADLVEPGIDRAFTISLQDLIQNQTSLSLVNTNGDLIFEGEIVEYYISPMSATAQNTAAQNRLTIAVNVRYYNVLEPEKDFERRFSFFYDYPATTQLVGAALETALDEIYTRITQDIFNAALADW